MSSSDSEPIDLEQKLLEEIGDIFFDFRLEKGWSQRSASIHLGTSQQNIPRLEKGRQDLKLSTLQKYAHAYGYKVEVNFVPLEG